MKKLTLTVLFLFTIILSSFSQFRGIAWKNEPQEIPGKIECEFYNTGGEGVAYHDKDSVNNGSGKLNPADGGFLNEFRRKEGVDISYTKSKDIDVSPYNKVKPEMNQLYVGWTEPGEWINYTVNVKKSGTYTIGVMYTANGDGIISLDVDGKESSGDLKVPSTNDEKEPIAWRQWHHWNKINQLGQVKLTKGIHTLTLHTVAHRNMNYDYLVFQK
jgi:hypothetical protein